MNGVQLDRGTRYNVSSTDLDILSDVGVGVVAGVGPVKPVPEPATCAMFAVGLLALGWRLNRQVHWPVSPGTAAQCRSQVSSADLCVSSPRN